MIFNLQMGRAQRLEADNPPKGVRSPQRRFRIANIARRTRRVGLSYPGYRTCKWPNAVTVGRACSILSSATGMFSAS